MMFVRFLDTEWNEVRQKRIIIEYEKNSRIDPDNRFGQFSSRIELRELSILNRNLQVDSSTLEYWLLLFRDYDRI